VSGREGEGGCGLDLHKLRRKGVVLAFNSLHNPDDKAWLKVCEGGMRRGYANGVANGVCERGIGVSFCY
jgi:hypothetical protein